MLFYCLETWCPRVRYCPVPGLPIEPNDISRLVAHNYLKCVDEQFLDSEALHYLRWVDDSVIFVKDKRTAEEVLTDIQTYSRLQAPALKYLQFFDLDNRRLGDLIKISGAPDASVQIRMEIARFFCDARLSCDSRQLVHSAFGEIKRNDERWGSGYAKETGPKTTNDTDTVWLLYNLRW